ncbi:MAG: formate dehydrogenase accessory sulfurtransferase FdhD [Dehalococcoidales bacterium]|nr:formate dehydrogenase accessory sulfurtransferase FdhD [Dehalococcoidales bacterium]
MKNELEGLPVLQYVRENKSSVEKVVAREFSLTIVLNNQELVTLLCSPSDLEYLAVGFLLSEGLLNIKDEIRSIAVDDRRGVARVETREGKELTSERLSKRLIASSGGRGTSASSAAAQSLAKVEYRSEITVPAIYTLVKEFQHHSRLYRATHGVHSAALCDADILVFAEDIGRHNAIDKVFGKCLMEDILTDGRMVVTSGRVSSEILLKVARRRIPVIISIAAPTDVAVELAGSLGVTLIGSVSGSKMNVFSHDWRILRDEEPDGNPGSNTLPIFQRREGAR